MLEEVGVPYELAFVDFHKGANKTPEFLALNPMGKLPTLVDDGTVVTESAAIALYLADRYAYGTLAPRVDDPRRAAYLRWSFFAPSVIEPGMMAKHQGWSFKDSQAGWGSYEAMLTTMESALSHGDWVLGDTFSMADVVFGGAIRYFSMFKTLEPRPVFTAYVERLAARPALQRAVAKNEAVRQERGITYG